MKKNKKWTKFSFIKKSMYMKGKNNVNTYTYAQLIEPVVVKPNINAMRSSKYLKGSILAQISVMQKSIEDEKYGKSKENKFEKSKIDNDNHSAESLPSQDSSSDSSMNESAEDAKPELSIAERMALQKSLNNQAVKKRGGTKDNESDSRKEDVSPKSPFSKVLNEAKHIKSPVNRTPIRPFAEIISPRSSISNSSNSPSIRSLSGKRNGVKPDEIKSSVEDLMKIYNAEKNNFTLDLAVSSNRFGTHKKIGSEMDDDDSSHSSESQVEENNREGNIFNGNLLLDTKKNEFFYQYFLRKKYKKYFMLTKQCL